VERKTTADPRAKARREQTVAIGALLLSVAFWGYSFISTKIVLSEIPPASVAFFRQIIAFFTLLIWLIPTKKFPRVGLRDLFQIALAAFFGIVLYFICENTGLQFTGASTASMIVSAVPVLTLFSEALFYKSKISARMVVCILLSVLGVYLVISDNGALDLSSSSFLGNLLVMGAMIAWVIYTMLNKKLSERFSSIALTAYQSLTSIFLFLPFVVSEMGSWRMPGIAPLGNLLYLGIFCSAFGYVFYINAAKKLGPTITSSFLNLTPVVTVVFGYFILGEQIVLVQMIGMVLILASLYILSRKS
jgi:drug/metabolite transporter (DMT)-like permease